jgi:uncharacterized membrane protein
MPSESAEFGIPTGEERRFVNAGAEDEREDGECERFLERGHGDGPGDCGARGGEGGCGNGSAEADGGGEDRVGGEVGGEGGGGEGQAAAEEARAELVEGAGDAFLGGVFVGAEGGADLTEVFVLKEAEDDGGAIRGGKGGDGFVEVGLDVGPSGVGRLHGGDFLGGLFAGLAAGFAADEIDGGAAGDDVEPRGERLAGREIAGATGEVEEDGLGDVFGEVRWADLAARGGINEIEMAGDELGEGSLVAGAGVALEQVVVAHVSLLSPVTREIRQRKSAETLRFGEKPRPNSKMICVRTGSRARICYSLARMNKQQRWLTTEVEKWTAAKIISGEQATAIRALYREPAGGVSWGLIVFFGIGAVVVGLGVILLFAYNWDAIPKIGKLALIFSAITAAHVGGVVQGRREGWRVKLGEALSLLGTMGFGAGIWLVAQIYSINEHFPTGFLIWGLGALAMAWALSSVAHGMLAAVLIAIWGLAEAWGFNAPMDGAALLLLVGVGPLVWRWRSALLLATVLVALYFLLLGNAAHWGGASAAFAAAFSVSALAVAAGKQTPSRAETDRLRTVATFFGLTGFVVCAYIASFHATTEHLLRWSAYDAANAVYAVFYRGGIFALALIAWVLVAWRAWRGDVARVALEEWLCPIALVYSQLVGLGVVGLGGWFVAVVFNLVCVGVASAWMVRGCRESRMRPVVLGSVLLSFVVFARYFDLFESLAVRGLVFVGFGAVLFAEGFFYRRLRATSEAGRADT